MSSGIQVMKETPLPYFTLLIIIFLSRSYTQMRPSVPPDTTSPEMGEAVRHVTAPA